MSELSEPMRQIMAACMYALAYGFGVLLFAWAARRRGLATAGVRAVAMAALVGGLAGATFAQLVIGGTPGRSLLGGIVFGYLAVIATKRQIGLRRPLGDLFAFALAGGEAVGRLGCFIGGCCYGKAAHVAWAIHDHDAWRHPTQLYASLYAALTLALLVFLDRRGRLPENGLFYVQGALFCAGRFVIEFYRDVAATPLGFTSAQLACIAGFAFFTWRLGSLLHKPLAQRVVAA